MDWWLAMLIGIVVGWMLRRWWKEDDEAEDDASEATGIYAVAERASRRFHQSAHPSDLLKDEQFLEGVTLLTGDEYKAADLLRYATGDNICISCMALEALSRRTDPDVVQPLLDRCNNVAYWPMYFLLRALTARAEGPILEDFLKHANPAWNARYPEQWLQEFIPARFDAGDMVHVAQAFAEAADDKLSWLEGLFDRIGGVVAKRRADEIRAWRNGRVDVAFLRSFGRIWQLEDLEREPVFEVEAVKIAAGLVMDALTADPPRSVVLVGEAGVGKTAVARAVAKQLLEDGWTLFEAGSVEFVADTMYIGELEKRITKFLSSVSDKERVLWIVPGLHELLWAGRHRYQPTGVLDTVLPHIESGRLLLLGEIRPAGHEKLKRAKPSLRASVEAVRVAPMGDEPTLGLARRWVKHHSRSEAPVVLDDATLTEALELTRQYLTGKSAPGNLLGFLESTRRVLAAAHHEGEIHITRSALVAALSRLTGLPTAILDEKETLDLRELRDYFEQRVLGQQDAVDCLVDRVAMIKAGLTDPTRPQGVFLFTGPTGTGKTEISKALASFLFGSSERMLRLDMSEFKSTDALDRILGESTSSSEGGRALVHAIAKNPFSIVLLDEFEKAHPEVWDLFLQVFDDGRLTDRRGITADFRHALIIMTSNVGGADATRTGIGFAGDRTPSGGDATGALKTLFRPEFLNRVDRVVTFRPLSRSVMRKVLERELEDVLHRRGLRNRQWAVEWDSSASEFLLEKGFSPELGARPLRRAVEQYLLAPLAQAIVNHQVPEGDQFLFVRSDGKALEVIFVDPDAAGPAEEDAAEPVDAVDDGGAAARAGSLEAVVLDGVGTSTEVALLEQEHERQKRVVEAETWREEKSGALSVTSDPEFWSSPSRHAVLGRVEYMDRIESGLRTSERLLRRLRGGDRRGRDRFSPQLVRAVAQRVYLLDRALAGLEAGEPADAFLRVEAAHEPRAKSNAFATRLAGMYRDWAEKRRMRLRVLEEVDGDERTPSRFLCAVSGFGAYSILGPEHGVHVLRSEGEDGDDKSMARVSVAPQPDEATQTGRDELRNRAATALGSIEPTQLQTVRSYRESPSPLVTDRVRGWRTGRIGHVLGGDFDLIG